jgi:hypothetical protein
VKNLDVDFSRNRPQNFLETPALSSQLQSL